MNTVTMILTYKNEAGTTTVFSKNLTGDLSSNVESNSLPGNTVDAHFKVNIPTASRDLSGNPDKVLALAFGCSKVPSTSTSPNPGTVTLIVSTTPGVPPTLPAPATSLVLTPANGYGWAFGDQTAIHALFSSDVNDLYVSSVTPSNPDDSAAAFFFTVRSLIDASV